MGHLSPVAPTLRILLVDRDVEARRTLRAALEQRIDRPLLVVEADAVDEAGTLAAGRGFDALAADLPTAGGPAALADLIRAVQPIAAYAMGAAENVMDAVAAVRAGAADFLEKPLDGAAFARRIERQFATADAVGSSFEGMVGRSPAMLVLYRQITRIAPSNASVFVFGEAGTGKSLAAAAVHARSRRRTGPFVEVRCGGSGDDFCERLFAPGGAFDRADGGTLHLAGLGTLDDAVQAALLGYLDGGEIGTPDRRRRPSVRIVASSRSDPGAMAGAGGIRPDLFFRLNVMTLCVPPLRERAVDVPTLADALLRRAARDAGRRAPRLSAAAERRLVGHDFPGNVRELADIAGRLVAAAPAGAAVECDAVEAALSSIRPAAAVRDTVRPLWLERERLIERAIAAFGGNVIEAAAALEISPSTIYRKRRPGGGNRPAPPARPV